MSREGNSWEGNSWEGNSVSNRLGVQWDDDMGHWVISGRHETDAATGSAREMVLLARLILENIPDHNGPPLGLAEECEALPGEASSLLARAVDLALNGAGGLDPPGRARLGGGLMAAALHLLSNPRDGGTYALRPVELPFGLRLDEPADELDGEASR